MIDSVDKLRSRAVSCRFTGNRAMSEEFDGYADEIEALHNQVDRLRSAVAAEREACAKIADDHSAWSRSFGSEQTCETIAAAIRARKPEGEDGT